MNDNVKNDSVIVHTGVYPIRAITSLLSKKDKSSLFSHRMGKKWDVEDQISFDFVTEIEKRFRRKNKKFGFFSEDIKAIPKELLEYCKSVDNSDQRFEGFSLSLASSIVSAADDVTAPASAGGNIVMMHYSGAEEDDLGRFLILLLEKKSMFDFDADLRPERLEPIDTSAIKQAALIDLNRLKDSYPSTEGEPYLTFIEGSSKAAFFKKALGCSEELDNERSVSQLREALDKYLLDSKVDDDVYLKVKAGFKALLQTASKTGADPLSLDKVQERIDTLLPEGHASKGGFAKFVNEHEYYVSEWFSPTSSQAGKTDRIKLSDDNRNYDVNVSENSIGPMVSDFPVKISDCGDYLCFPLNEKRELVNKLVSLSEQDEPDA